MFAVGVDEMSWDDLNEANYDWPKVAEVKDYRKAVRALVNDVICSLPLDVPINWDDPFWAILMGIEHERIHIETSSVIIRRLPIEMVRPLPLLDICTDSGPAPENELLPVAGGRVVLGKPRNDPLYGWDNEYGRQQTDVWDFRRQPLSGLQPGVSRLCRGPRLRERGALDGRRPQVARVHQGQASAVLDRRALRGVRL